MKTAFHLDYPTILANQARPVCFAIRFEAEQFSSPRPQPTAFCVVLDRSGSMEGPPLAHAREATKLAVRNLRAGDQFALVIFDDEARTVIPLQAVKNKQELCTMIDGIFSNGSTNLTGGWMLGRDELAKATANTTRRLLLLTDGQLNRGIIDPLTVKQVVGAGLEKNLIRTSCLGFGDDYNEDLLAALASATNGQFYDADSPEKLPAIFAAELDGLQKLCVQNLRVRMQRGDFCDQFVLLGEYPSVALPDGRIEYAIGDLVSEEERIVCFAVQSLGLPVINGKPVCDLQGESLLVVEILWDEFSEQGIASQTLTQTVRIQATQDPAAVVVNSVVAPWVSLQKAGAVAVEVNRQMDQGNQPAALNALDQAIQEIRQYGEQGAEAVKMLEALKTKIAGENWDMRSRKTTRYMGTTLRKMSSTEMWTSPIPPPSFKKNNPPNPPTTPPPTGTT